MARSVALAALLSSIGGCMALPLTDKPQSRTPLTPVHLIGHWGGVHVGLELGPDGGRITYDCAAGSIAAVTPDASGRFVAEGTHQPGHGGPVRQGESAPSFAAHFTGAVQGTRMTLTGRIANGTLIGPFTLLRGADATLYRCL